LGFIATLGRKFALKRIFERKPLDLLKRYEVELQYANSHKENANGQIVFLSVYGNLWFQNFNGTFFVEFDD